MSHVVALNSVVSAASHNFNWAKIAHMCLISNIYKSPWLNSNFIPANSDLIT